MADSQETVAHIKEFIRDQTHFIARYLKAVRQQLDIDEEILSAGCSFFLASYMATGMYAQFVCNSILVSIPISIMYVYPKERPDSDLLFIYWCCFSTLSLFDLGFDNFFPAYYVLKILLLSLPFVRPFCFAKLIDEEIKTFQDVQKEMAEKSESLGTVNTTKTAKERKPEGASEVHTAKEHSIVENLPK